MTDERRGGGGLGAALILLVFVGFVAKFWIWIVAVLGAAAVLGLLGWLLVRADDRRSERIIADREIAERADKQHAQILAGDDRGVYGMFPPAAPPPAPPVPEPLPAAGQNWSDYLAETRERAKQPVVHTGSGAVRWV